MSNHFTKICVCGAKIASCKCPGPRVVEIVRPCVHVLTVTNAIISDYPITLDNIVHVMDKYRNDFAENPTNFKVNKYTYNKLRDYFLEKEAEEEAQGVEKPEMPYHTFGSIFGIEIRIDEDMKDGEWKFE